MLALSRASGSHDPLFLNSSQILLTLSQKNLFIKSAICFGFEITPESVEKMVGERLVDHPANLLTLFQICLPVMSSSAIFCSLKTFLAASSLRRLLTLFFSFLQFSQSSVEFVLFAIFLSLFLFLILWRHSLEMFLFLFLMPPVLKVRIGACLSRTESSLSVIKVSISVGSF